MNISRLLTLTILVSLSLASPIRSERAHPLPLDGGEPPSETPQTSLGIPDPSTC